MTQQRLNHCALLHVLREECDELDLRDIAKDFFGLASIATPFSDTFKFLCNVVINDY